MPSDELVLIHRVLPTAKCSLSGKEAECIVCTFADGSFREVTISWNSLKQLVRLKGQQGEPPTEE